MILPMTTLFVFIINYATISSVVSFAWKPNFSTRTAKRVSNSQRIRSPLHYLSSTQSNAMRDDKSFDDFSYLNNAKVHSHDKKLDLNILLLDHYDSFTYNLADYLAQQCIKPPTVLAADCVDDWEQLLQLLGDNYDDFDGIVLSPGPGNPSSALGADISDFSLARDILTKNPNLPILGVCLGHQIMGDVYGARVELAPEPVHGQIRNVRLLPDQSENDPLWMDIPQIFNVTRYHSLHVCDLDDTPLVSTAVSADENDLDGISVLMGMRHQQNPHFGVQFHPESIGTPTGMTILRNFLRVAAEKKTINDRKSPKKPTSALTNDQSAGPKYEGKLNEKSNATVNVSENQQQSPYSVYIHKVPVTSKDNRQRQMLPSDVMSELLSSSKYSFWLDGESPEAKAQQQFETNGNAQSDRPSLTSPPISILGGITDASHSLERVEYWGKEKPVDRQGLFVYKTTEKSSDLISKVSDDILSYLETKHARSTQSATIVSFEEKINGEIKTNVILDKVSEDNLLRSIPFEFRGGHVGYLGYEVRHDTAKFLEEEEGGRHSSVAGSSSSGPRGTCKDSKVPTAAFLWADRSFVFVHDDNGGGDWYLVGVIPAAEEIQKEKMFDWMQQTARKLQGEFKDKTTTKVCLKGRKDESSYETVAVSDRKRISFRPNRPRSTYNRNFDDCIEYIRQGESYELCLTNHFETKVSFKHDDKGTIPAPKPLDLYHVLRRRNLSPFSAFLNWNSLNDDSGTHLSDAAVAICCTSPERFVSVKRRKSSHLGKSKKSEDGTTCFEVEAKPIKGTCRRVIPDTSAGRDVSKKVSVSSPLGLSYSESEMSEDAARARSLQSSVKNQAENLMIVDLLRNDLSRVCNTGTVHVAKLFGIESFPTVHQMVSTIRGTMSSSPHSSPAAVKVLKALFPGGSMTGAPKLRTMELLDGLEAGASRGPYSGSFGYISTNGAMDMNIIIRTAILTPNNDNYARKANEVNEESKKTGETSEHGSSWNVRIGAGGAITALSESADEYEEMLLKASAIINAVEEWATPGEYLLNAEINEKETGNYVVERSHAT